MVRLPDEKKKKTLRREIEKWDKEVNEFLAISARSVDHEVRSCEQLLYTNGPFSGSVPEVFWKTTVP